MLASAEIHLGNLVIVLKREGAKDAKKRKE